MTGNVKASLTIRLKDLVSGPAEAIKRAINGIGSASAKIPATGGGLARLAETVKGFNLAGNLALAGQGMTTLGNQARGALTMVLRPAMDFDAAMARVGAITQGIDARGIQDLNAAAKDLGESTGMGPVMVARGLEALAQEGYNAKQQLSTLPIILQLSKVSGLELGASIDVVTDSLDTFNLGTEEAARVAGMLGGVSLTSGTGVQQLFTALQSGAPAALAAGVSLKEVVTIVGLLGSVGVKGNKGAMAMNAMLMALGSPGKVATQALDKIGISGKDMALGLQKPAQLLKLINERMNAKGLDATSRFRILESIFGPRLMKSMPTLINALNKVGEDGKTEFDKIADAAENGEAKLNKVTAAMGETSTLKIKKLNASLERLYIDLAEQLAPILGPLLKDLKEMIAEFSKWSKQNPELIRAIGQFLIGVAAVAAILGPITLAVSSLVTAFSLLKMVAKGTAIPFKIIGNMSAELGRQASIATGPAKVLGGALRGVTAAVGLVGAAFAGWEVGKLLDSVIGKVFKLKNGLLSTEIGLKMGKSAWFNTAIGWIPGMEDVAKGNERLNAAEKTDEKALLSEAEAAVGAVPTWITPESEKPWTNMLPRRPEPVKVGGKIDINIDVSDKRAKVTKVIAVGKGAELEVGYNTVLQ